MTWEENIKKKIKNEIVSNFFLNLATTITKYS